MIKPAHVLLACVSTALLTATLACSSSNSADGISAGASSEVVTSGSPIVSGIGGKCLDDRSDLTSNDNEIDLWQCNGTVAQKWAYTNRTFVGPGGKCLDIHRDQQVAGTPVDLYTCNGTKAQQWIVDGTAIKSTDGYCLDVAGGVNANGTQIQLAECAASAESQVWHVTGSSNASCTFSGKTIASGSNVSPNPYTTATVPYGQTCTTETVTCNDGVLSPSGASPTCTVLSANTGPSLRQYAVEQTNGGSGVSEVNSVKQFTTPTQKGNAIWVVATIPNDGAQKNVTVSDTQGNTFTALNFEQDSSQGAQSVWQFYAADIKGDTDTADTVTVHWGYDNYKGVLIAEVASVSASPLVGHSGDIQDGNAASGNNTVTSGDIAVAATETPAILLAVSMDTFGGTSDLGGDLSAGPLAGEGFTEQDDMWNFDPGQKCTGSVPCNLGAFETKEISAAGSEAGLFTARAPSNSARPGDYVTVSAVFR